MNAARRAAVVGLLVLALPRPARAQSAEDKAAAETLFENGKQLMRDRNFAEACPKFAESLRLDPGIGTELWLADCFEKTGRIASAWGMFRDAAESALRERDSREKIARSHAARLEPRLPKLTISVPEPARADGLVVKRDDAVVDKPVWGTEVPVDPGGHVVSATAPGKKPWQRSVNVGESHAVAIVVPQLEDEPAKPPERTSSPGGSSADNGPPSGVLHETPEQGPAPGTTQRLVGLVAVGVGVVGLGVGTYFGLSAKSHLDDSNANGHCTPDNRCDPIGTQARNDAKSAALVSTLAFVGGAALIAGGAALYLTAPKAGRSVAATGLLLPGGGGLAVRAVW